MTKAALAHAYHAVTDLVTRTPELVGFAGWPKAEPHAQAPRALPAADILRAWRAAAAPATHAAFEAIRAIAPHVAWRQTYREDEVGADFLARYGWFELVGPTGHFRAKGIRAYVAFWDTGLDYPWHVHRAEELYVILAGRARFEAGFQASAILRPGDIRVHAPNEPHAMTTPDSPVLALVLWRGAGLEGHPRLGRA